MRCFQPVFYKWLALFLLFLSHLHSFKYLLAFIGDKELFENSNIVAGIIINSKYLLLIYLIFMSQLEKCVLCWINFVNDVFNLHRNPIKTLHSRSKLNLILLKPDHLRIFLPPLRYLLPLKLLKLDLPRLKRVHHSLSLVLRNQAQKKVLRLLQLCFELLVLLMY